MYKISSETLQEIYKHLKYVNHEKLQPQSAIENERLIKVLEEEFHIEAHFPPINI